MNVSLVETQPRCSLTDYQAFLLKLHRNLNILREREAKYGGNAPLELLNQIEDHQQAIALTKQALEGEITEVEWKKTTKHLLAFSGGQVVNIEAETYVAGDQITHIHTSPKEPPFWSHLSRANLVLAAVVGVFSIVGAIAAVLAIPGFSDYVYNFFRPLPFPPATDKETLIVIATFHHTEGIADTDAHNEIRRAIETAITELNVTNLRVEVEPTRLTGDDQDAARKLGERYGASMVIWGADTGVRVTVNFLNLKEPDYEAAAVKISETERTQLANPSAYARFITNDLPGQLTFLALFAVGQSYYIQADYPQAIRVIEKAVAVLPPQLAPTQGAAEAYFRLGWLYHKQSQFNQAIVAYTEAIKHTYDPLAWPHAYRAAAYYQQGNYEQAIADTNNAIKLDQKFDHISFVYIIRGAAYYQKENYQQAIADFTEAIELGAEDAATYFLRGLTYYGQGNYQQAISDYNNVIKLEPKKAEAYRNRGNAYRQLGKYQQATTDYNKAIDLDPNYVDAYNERGTAYQDLRNYQQAIADYTKAIELDPKYVGAYNNRGTAYADLGDYQQAIVDYTKAISLDRKSAGAYSNLGLAYAKQGDYERAIVNCNKAIELDPELASAYQNRGFIYYKQGDYEQAIADFNKVIKLDPKFVYVYGIRGLAYADQGDYQRAILDFTKATELESSDLQSWQNLCFAGSLAGMAIKVIKACEQAVKLAPDNGWIHNNRGLARALTGDYQGAIEDFKFFVHWSKENDMYEKYGRKREAWIAELEAGRNPFDKATLEELRKE